MARDDTQPALKLDDIVERPTGRMWEMRVWAALDNLVWAVNYRPVGVDRLWAEVQRNEAIERARAAIERLVLRREGHEAAKDAERIRQLTT